MNRVDAARELGVAWDAPPDRVESAFRHAVRLRHPDVGGDAASFRRATEARAVLLSAPPDDPLARAVEVLLRYHPAARLVEVLFRVVDGRSTPR